VIGLSALLVEHCPEGVTFEALGDIVNVARQRADPNMVNTSNYVGVENLVPDFGGRVDCERPPAASAIAYESGNILFGNIRPYLKKAWLADGEGGASPDVITFAIKPERLDGIDPAFLYHIITSRRFIEHVVQNSRGGKMPRGNKESMLAFVVPVPPLPVQRAIVDALSRMKGLEYSLREEEELRRLQFQHYRGALFSTVRSGCADSTLGGVSAKVSTGATPTAGKPDYYDGGTIPWLRTAEVRFADIFDTEMRITKKALASTGANWIPEDCVIIAISGATAGRSAINRIPVTTNQHCCNLQIDPDRADYRFVFHWVHSRYDELKALGRGPRGDLNTSIIKGFQLPVPSLDEQRFVVERLDAMQSLIDSLTAERVSRREQFEHYRERLLTLPERTSAA
jgi:type I restriction enzyme, S subunit